MFGVLNSSRDIDKYFDKTIGVLLSKLLCNIVLSILELHLYIFKDLAWQLLQLAVVLSFCYKWSFTCSPPPTIVSFLIRSVSLGGNILATISSISIVHIDLLMGAIMCNIHQGRISNYLSGRECAINDWIGYSLLCI